MNKELEGARALAKALVLVLKEENFTDEERLEIAEIVMDVVCLSCGKILPDNNELCSCISPEEPEEPEESEEPITLVIACKVCGSEHDPATPFEDSLQGQDCAASVQKHSEYGWVLIGSYGSTLVDTKMYKVLDEELQVATEPVCDDCISAWIKNNRIKLLREDVF